MATMPLPELPLDVLSNIVKFIPPPYSAPPVTSPLVDTLDPRPPPAQSPSQAISAVSRSSSKLLEASRPWLWADVEVRTGRGWLAIVNALTEEVMPEDPHAEGGNTNINPIAPIHGNGIGLGAEPASPISPVDAHRQPATIANGYARYTAAPPPSFPYAIPSSLQAGPSTRIPNHMFSYSPPQPSHAALLLTPPGSRNSSPHAIPAPAPIPNLKSSTSAATARLRGRSRSPQRSINFDTEGISSVLDRSRSGSAEGRALPRSLGLGVGIPKERRRSSLSRTRVMMDPDEDIDEDKEYSRSRSSSHRSKSPMPLPLHEEAEEEQWWNVNPELLPDPGAYIRHISFNNFRTIGSRRTQEEAVRGRFVTAGRLEGVIKNAPNLLTLCMTEYVDSSLSYDVLEELLFRGYRRPKLPRRSSLSTSMSRVRSMSIGPSPDAPAVNQLDPPRPTYVPYERETEPEMWSRRAQFSCLEALDLTGCVSAAFRDGIKEFWETWLERKPEVDALADQNRGRGRGRERRRVGDATDDETDTTDMEHEHEHEHEHRALEVEQSRQGQVPMASAIRGRRSTKFRKLTRLSLRACHVLEPLLIHDFVLAFPALTHLDLSNTRVPSSLLIALTNNPPATLRLQSLSLARCPKIACSVLVNFICDSPAAAELVELNLYVSPTGGNAIESKDLTRLLKAPAFKSGKLRYLDLSSAQFTPAHLTPEVFPPQPSLLSLGLSHIPSLPLEPIATFLTTLAPNVEILTLAGTAMDSSLRPSKPPLQINLEIHGRLINPLTTVPFSLSALSMDGNSRAKGINFDPGPTKLRIIELSSPIRRAIVDGGGGSGEWKIIRSKGGRGWYVDTSAGWASASEPGAGAETAVGKRFVRHLPRDEPWRKWLTGLSDAEGRVGSGIGWHSRKMEVVRGFGMLGREEGLAGAGGFAFDE